MAKKNKKNNIKIIWIVVIVVVLLFLLLTKFGNLQKATAPTSSSITPTANALRTYHSDFLDTTIDIPSNFTIKEVYGLQEIELEKEGKLINVHVFGTNRAYKDIEEFLDDIDTYDHQPKKTSSEQIKIDGLDCEVVLTKYVNRPELNNKAYNCFINSNVFSTISTKSESLYSDLDQIASSFRYEPKPTR